MITLRIVKGALHFVVYAALCTVLLPGCIKSPEISDTEGLIRNDSVRINLADSILLHARHKAIDSIKNSWNDLIKDSTKLKAETVRNVIKVLDDSDVYYKKIIANKNTLLFDANRKLMQCGKRPHVWILIGIVFFTGILGGIAGPRFSLLTEDDAKVVKAAQEAADRSQAGIESLKQAASGRPAFTESLEFKEVIHKAENFVQSMKDSAEELKEAHQRKYAYLLFGFIAAALSFVALNLFDSKILDFNSVIDYFIFAGYCLLGAVFAKKWIVKLYDAITT